MASPRAVKRALRALVTERRLAEDSPAVGDSTAVSDARESIETAGDALDDVESAAGSATNGGFERVRDAAPGRRY
ncbi:hypothetical protein [Haloprofundus salilacus]|uniref:hypothetical protein n=1 Tax=Haloprofundus salilacus TaxID=2876190 RepID=UPI001CCADB03|nr:hypothetical protein [Haloprofundus salilacus]